MIRDFRPRLYQETILNTAALKNTLVVLPTGMGKTFIFLMLAAQRLLQYPGSKVLLLGPTKPLIDQYHAVFKEHFDLPEEQLAVFTGEVPPARRAALWKDAAVVFSTPQGLENDIISGKIALEEVTLLGVDEAHRAVGSYAYVWIVKQYLKMARFPRVLGLTASPGSQLDRVREVCKNLGIEEIEMRTYEDPDVQPYVQEVRIEWVTVKLPESFSKVHGYLQACERSKVEELRRLMALESLSMRRGSLLELQGQIQARLSHGERDFSLMRASSLLAEALKVEHAVGLLESQGVQPLHLYLTKLVEESRTSAVKAVQNLVKDLNFRSACVLTEGLISKGVQHPKMGALRGIVTEELVKGDRKVIIFTQYRDTGVMLVNDLHSLPEVKARLFVGQAKKSGTGMSQKEQRALLEEFRDGAFQVIVATSIGEEGLDIPKVDLVVFYEPVPSAIRTIQRRGRTGRLHQGRVVVLIAEKTRDEPTRWIAQRKEQRMHRILAELRNEFKASPPAQPTLDSFQDRQAAGIRIFADHRERESGILRSLAERGAEVELSQLACADFVLSSRVAVELKTVPDFVDSLIDGRLLEQVRQLRQSFEAPLVIVEGTEDVYSMRRVHPNAIRGMFATIAVSYGIPLIFTRNSQETTEYILLIARREQDESGRGFSPHGSRKPATMKELQEYIVSALPGIGPTLGKDLLASIGSVEGVMTASEERLRQIGLIGEKKAKDIRRVVGSPYEHL